jgi:prepilin-type N-terminal cleavage/methylation domain-containing protein
VEAETELGPRAGFSLIEVLIAMVILAVGLLAIEAMAIGASRMVAGGDRNTEYTLLATQRLETQLLRVRGTTTQNPQASDSTVNGVRVQVVPTSAAVAGVTNAGGTLWTITVTVTPPSTVTNVKPVTVVASAFR